MKYGKNEAETLRLNNFGVGDVLEGNEGYGLDRIIITAIGQEHFLCKWDHLVTGTFGREVGHTTLIHRDWKKVSK